MIRVIKTGICHRGRRPPRKDYHGGVPTPACPICRKPAPWDENPFRPFCSERCRLRDLGAWSAESYRLPTKPEEAQDESWSGDMAD